MMSQDKKENIESLNDEPNSSTGPNSTTIYPDIQKIGIEKEENVTVVAQLHPTNFGRIPLKSPPFSDSTNRFVTKPWRSATTSADFKMAPTAPEIVKLNETQVLEPQPEIRPDFSNEEFTASQEYPTLLVHEKKFKLDFESPGSKTKSEKVAPDVSVPIQSFQVNDVTDGTEVESSSNSSVTPKKKRKFKKKLSRFAQGAASLVVSAFF